MMVYIFEKMGIYRNTWRGIVAGHEVFPKTCDSEGRF